MSDNQSSIERLTVLLLPELDLVLALGIQTQTQRVVAKQGLLKMRAGTAPKAQRGGGWGWPTGPEVLGFT